MRAPGDTAIEAYGVMLDITERKEAEERDRLLIAELDHRLNNTLARIGVLVQQSIAEHSQATAASVEALASGLTGRLGAVARAHMRLGQGNWEGASLKQVVEEELAPYQSEANVSLEGLDLPINPGAARSLGMVIHELVTNAVKYGALSTADGRVSVRWQLADEISSAELKIVWQEEGAPAGVAPKRQGFGTRLIDTLVRHDLGGQLEHNVTPMGLRCEMKIPLARLTGAAARTVA